MECDKGMYRKGASDAAAAGKIEKEAARNLSSTGRS